MADKRKSKRRKEDFQPTAEVAEEKPQKEEYSVADWLKKNVPVKKTKFLNHNVQYFTGSKAVDALMESKWAKPEKEGEEPLFPTREHCVTFLDEMLRHKFFHRAKKVAISEELLKSKKKRDVSKSSDEKEKKTDKEKTEKKEEEVGESSHAEGKAPEVTEDEERKKKKKKVRLEMHFNQYFEDNLDAYVWLYDPIPIYYWLFGFLLVLAGIGICLFPLWPPSVRMGVYYLSIAAAGFLVFIIALAVIRFKVFCLIWLLTLGSHHLWLFPNLTEDVGFFASFWPLYHYEYKGGESSSSTKKKKKKKEKLSDNEEEAEIAKSLKEPEPELENQEDQAAEGNQSGSESEGSSQQSQTGKDFEMVEKDDVVEAH
ncbi:translocation protein [Nesidiocoris tenuis]|uniref:Translocation protein SEC62 n=1 Tax=Nesidiocoris tenuis TaxID=355587 RepID=A0ABN7AWA2_9HEMI|nr:translocation protein [Nesidiocoris tenuis]